MRLAYTAILSFSLFATSLSALAGNSTIDATTDTVLIVGDSLSSAHRMPETAGWVALLDRRLVAHSAHAPAIVNASRGGKTLADALTELPSLLAEHRPDVVLLELGGNDAILGAKGPEIRRDLARLVDLSRGAGAKVAVLGFAIPPAFDKDGSADLLRDAYAAVADEKDVALLPSLLAGISDQPSLLQDDGIHPNADAQSRVLENAWPTLKPLLLK
ncbi:GDSL-type esterase/lipase family protein [Lysobacter panacisoli]|uniref:Arylesterase n=1 Tax=Lysobacter panacisoli TaxID=1255263 RepID=A0ABP9L7J4_9GAMM|nr:GDSL-type esterase/lipase family protein [Lysobacter panacisoli]